MLDDIQVHAGMLPKAFINPNPRKWELCKAQDAKDDWNIDETRKWWAGVNGPEILRVQIYPFASALHHVVQCKVCRGIPSLVLQKCFGYVAKSKAPREKRPRHSIASTVHSGGSSSHSKCPPQRLQNRCTRMRPGSCRSSSWYTTCTSEMSPNHDSRIHHNNPTVCWGHNWRDPLETCPDQGVENAEPSDLTLHPRARHATAPVPILYATHGTRRMTWRDGCDRIFHPDDLGVTRKQPPSGL